MVLACSLAWAPHLTSLTARHAGPKANPNRTPTSLTYMRGGTQFVPKPQTPNLAVGTVLVCAFLNLLGFTMALPINAALRSHFHLPMGSRFGALSCAYPLGTFGALMIWPRLSDKVGRRPIISLSLAGTGLGLLFQSVAIESNWSLGMFLLCRLVTGFFAGAGPVAKAFLADVGAVSGQLPRFMAWRDAANTCAFIAGPWLGGIVYSATNSLAAVIGVTAAGSLVASILVALFVSESKQNETISTLDSNTRLGQRPATLRKPEPQSTQPTQAQKGYLRPGDDYAIVSCPLGKDLVAAVTTVCCISSLYNCGSATFSAFFAPLAQDLAGLSVKSIGTAYTCLASISFIVSTCLSAQFQRRLGTVFTCVIGLLAVATSLFFMGLIASLAPLSPAQLFFFWLSSALFQVGTPLYAPTVPTMLLQCVPRHRRGAIMGLDEACNTIARVTSPLILGGVYAKFGPFACLSAASGAVALGILLTVYRRFVVLRQSYA